MLRPNTEVIISCTFLRLSYRIIGPYKDVFRTSKKDVLEMSLRDVFRTLVGYVPWVFILDHVGDPHNICRRRP